MRCLSTILTICLILGGLQTQQCEGQIVPYRLFGLGQADPVGGDQGLGSFFGPAVAWWIGPMDYYAEAVEIELIVDNEGNPTGFEYYAIDTQTAWDGSEIYLDGSGTATLIPRPDLGPTHFNAIWDGQFNILGGSGRFENAGPGTAPIELFLFQYAFDLTDNETLRPYFYTKRGNWNLGWFGG